MTISRRDFLKISAIAGAAIGMGATARKLIQTNGFHKVSETHQLMGTIINFVIVAESENAAHDAIQDTVDEMRRLIQMYDYRLADSPLGRLNANGITHHTFPELIATIQQSLHFSLLSQGAFDVTVKPVIDALQENRSDWQKLIELVDYRQLSVNGDTVALSSPGMSVTLDGIAKGSVVDGGVAILRQLGFEDVLVEAGGDMMAKGSPNGEAWRVGIAHPRARGEFIAKISVQNQAVATSGDYMNYFSDDYSSYHIIDPRSGKSPSTLASATVIAPSVAEADALSTTLMVLGVADGLALIEKLPDTAALIVTKDLKIYRSVNFPIG
ncbi:MAG: FAD:protein FMN transferase [Anaerolineales bacterium]|nr:FAD:protein FMN transferase [Anaerolineales bacterium]